MTRTGRQNVTALDFEQLQAMFHKYQQEAEELNVVLKQTKNQVQDLHRSGWVGRGSDKFYADMENQVLPALDRLVKALQLQAIGLGKIVNTFHKARVEIQGRFKQFHSFNIKKRPES